MLAHNVCYVINGVKGLHGATLASCLVQLGVCRGVYPCIYVYSGWYGLTLFVGGVLGGWCVVASRIVVRFGGWLAGSRGLSKQLARWEGDGRERNLSAWNTSYLSLL